MCRCITGALLAFARYAHPCACLCCCDHSSVLGASERSFAGGLPTVLHGCPLSPWLPARAVGGSEVDITARPDALRRGVRVGSEKQGRLQGYARWTMLRDGLGRMTLGRLSSHPK